MPKLPMTAIALVAIAALAACESNGHTRYASIGTVGPGGSSGSNGSDGGSGSNGSDGVNGSDGTNGSSGTGGQNGGPGIQGPEGPAGPAGPQGEPGGNFMLGDTGLIATGGLVGPSGVGGTGLLANFGDPSTSIPIVSDAGTSGGTIVTALATGLDSGLGQADLPPELANLTGATTQTVANVGEALEAFGTDGAPLVDGVTSAISPILTASLGEGTLAGDESGSSLIGLSLLSSEQQSGTLAEVGVASGDSLLNVDLSPESDTALDVGTLASVDLGPVTDGVNDLLDETGLSGVTGMIDLGTAEEGLLADVTETASGLMTGEGDLAGLIAPVEGLLTGEGDLAGLTAPVEDLLSGGEDLLGLTDPEEGLLGEGGLLASLTEPVEDLIPEETEDTDAPLDTLLPGLTGPLGGLLGGGR